MGGFKDMVCRDNRKVFLNADFFGEEHKIGGKLITIVIDNDELAVRKGGQDYAIAESQTLFYAQSSDLPKRQPPGQTLNIDGRERIIDDWTEDMGMATVVLRENITA